VRLIARRGWPARQSSSAGTALAIILTLDLLAASSALADGVLPPEAYNFLHPPPSLAATNLPPLAGDFTLRASHGTSRSGTGTTGDFQAGLDARSGAFRTSPHAGGVRIQIRAVKPPGHLPAGVSLDGNAYRYEATERPGGGAPTLVGRALAIFEWPYPPSGLYGYAKGAWHRVCSYRQALITSSTLICPVKFLGVFIVTMQAGGLERGDQPRLGGRLLAPRRPGPLESPPQPEERPLDAVIGGKGEGGQEEQR
jgi:hypothetical protein